LGRGTKFPIKRFDDDDDDFSAKMNPYFELAFLSFFREIPKIGKRESICQKFGIF